jgi:hypothetical protein
MRRFPPPWTIEEHNNACFIVKDATGQAFGYFDFRDERNERWDYPIVAVLVGLVAFGAEKKTILLDALGVRGQFNPITCKMGVTERVLICNFAIGKKLYGAGNHTIFERVPFRLCNEGCGGNVLSGRKAGVTNRVAGELKGRGTHDDKGAAEPILDLVSWRLTDIFESDPEIRLPRAVSVKYFDASDGDVGSKLPLGGILHRLQGFVSSFSLDFGGVGRFLRGVGGNLSVLQAFADENELPEKQDKLATSYDDKPKREKSYGLTSDPGPDAFVWFRRDETTAKRKPHHGPKQRPE